MKTFRLCVLTLSLWCGTANAFKIEGHVWLANEILKEMATQQGRVKIAGGLYTLDSKVRNALASTSGRGAFLMGVMGADIYPDMLAGQMTTHPGVNAMVGGKVAWQTDDWLKFVMDRAVQSGNADALAFAVGYSLHAAMDMWAHTYVNGYAGDVFSIVDYPEVAERHVALEAYLKKFHKTLISNDNPNDNVDAYTPLRVPAAFVADTLILNQTVAAQYAAEPATLYLSMIWNYQQSFVQMEQITTNLATDIANELERIQPILAAIRAQKVNVDKHREAYEGHLTRLTEGAVNAIDFAVQVAENSNLLGIVEGVTGDIELDAPAQTAKNILSTALQIYQKEVDKLNYGINGMLDVDTLQQGFVTASSAVSGSMATAMRHNIRLAMIAYIRAWEETAKELMRPPGKRFTPGSDFKQPMMHWAQCWAPLLAMPVANVAPIGSQPCQRTMEGIADFQHARAVLQNQIGDLIPLVATIKDDIEAFDSAIANIINVKAKGISNAMADVVPSGSPDVIGMVNWLFTMWDKHPSATDVDTAYSDSDSAVPFLERPITAAVHRDLNVCTGAKVASSLADAPIKDFAPMQNAVTMAKMAMLPVPELNRLLNNLNQSSNAASANKTGGSAAAGAMAKHASVKNMMQAYPTSPKPPPAGAVLFGALRSIDGDHQWLPVAPPLPRAPNVQPSDSEQECRRFGYPSGSAYPAGSACSSEDNQAAAVLAAKPGFAFRPEGNFDTAFRRLFSPVDTSRCDWLIHLGIANAGCVAGESFPIYSPEPGTSQPVENAEQGFVRKDKQISARRQRPTANRAKTANRATTPPTANRAKTAPKRQQGTKKKTQRTVTQRRKPAPRTLRTRAAPTSAMQTPGGLTNPAAAPLADFNSFQANASSHHWANSYLLALMSYVSYPGALGSGSPNKAQLAAQLAQWQLELVDWIDVNPSAIGSGSTQVLVAANDDALILAFRGSTITPEDLAQDWYDNDLDISPHPMPSWGKGVILHDGFIDAASLVFDRVAQLVSQHGQGRRVWLTGHSLGGANAVLNAFELKRRKLPVQGVYIYGSPPVGNTAWQNVYHQTVANTHRWSIQNDPVASVMVQLPGPFAHVGYRNNLLASGEVDLAHSKELVYPINRGGRGIVRDLSSTHMSYWCRLRDAAQNLGNFSELPVPPNSECDLCRF